MVVAIAAMVVALGARVEAAPVGVVVRDDGRAALALARLRGQVADLDIALTIERGPIEPALPAQLSAAARLAARYAARAVVWFIVRPGGLVVAVSMPGEHRLFLREIPPADASAVAEAAAVAARGAIRAISEGSTIGEEINENDLEPPPALRLGLPRSPSEPPSEPPRSSTMVELGLGWQVALDGGADAGAHAIAQRTSVVLGSWAVGLALAVGPPLRGEASADVTVKLSRSDAMLGVERRFGGLGVGVAAGAVLYRRTTLAAPVGLSPTPAAINAAFAAAPELRWRWRSGRFGIEAVAALDVVIGAPELVVARGAQIETLGELRMLQPRFGLNIIAGLR